MTDQPKSIDLVEIEPGLYGLRPHDPYADQWKGFWDAIKFFAVATAIVGVIDILVTY